MDKENWEKIFGYAYGSEEHLNVMRKNYANAFSYITRAQDLSDKWIAEGGKAEKYGRQLRVAMLPLNNTEVVNAVLDNLKDL